MALLAVCGLDKTFEVRGKTVAAVAGIDLEVEEGSFVAIVGPSGCGKSTVLNMIAGLTGPSRGRILYRGSPVIGVISEIGYVTQQHNLFPWRTLIRNVELPLELRGVPKRVRRERARALIETAGLAGFEHAYPHELSGGMLQRASIIRSLIYEPVMVLMDEPFGQLDALTRTAMQDYLLKLWARTRKTVLFVTHDLREAIGLADRVLVMTARPGVVKTDNRVPIPRPRDIFRIHEHPDFGAIYNDLWAQLVAEVTKSMTS